MFHSRSSTGHLTHKIIPINNLPEPMSNKYSYFKTTTSTNYTTESAKDDYTKRLRYALCEAISYNEVLREKVMELYALLVSAAEEIFKNEANYICDMNRMCEIVERGRYKEYRGKDDGSYDTEERDNRRSFRARSL